MTNTSPVGDLFVCLESAWRCALSTNKTRLDKTCKYCGSGVWFITDKTPWGDECGESCESGTINEHDEYVPCRGSVRVSAMPGRNFKEEL